jgi:IPT/TIG domain
MPGSRASRRRWYRRASPATAVIAAAVLVAGGCSSSGQAAQPQRPAVPSAVRVDPGHSAVLRLQDGLTVSVPAGAVSGPGTLSAAAVTAPAGAPSGLELTGPVYDLRLSGTTLRGNVRLTVPVMLPRRPGQPAGPDAALLAYYNRSGGGWQPVNASYDPAAHVLTATSAHLSTWSVLGVDAAQATASLNSAFGSFFGAGHAAQPSCPDSAQLTALKVQVASDPGDLVKWCADDISASALVRITSNRSYAMEADYPSTWAMSRAGPLDPVTAVILKWLPALSLRAGGPQVSTAIIPGDQQVDVTAQRGTSGIVLIGPSAEGIIVDALQYAAQTLAMTFGDIPWAGKPSQTATAKAMLLVLDDAQCAAKLAAVTQNPDVSTSQAAGRIFRGATDIVFGCLASHWTAAYQAPAPFLAQFTYQFLLWAVSGAELIEQDSQALIDSALYWQGYHIYVRSSQGPTSPSGPATSPQPQQSPTGQSPAQQPPTQQPPAKQSPAPFAVTSSSPASGPASGGTVIVIHGSGFSSVNNVVMNTVHPLPEGDPNYNKQNLHPHFTVVSDTEIDVTTTPGAAGLTYEIDFFTSTDAYFTTNFPEIPLYTFN